MKILSIDTSALAASVAVTFGSRVVCEFTLNDKINHSVTVMPLISQALAAINTSVSEMDYIACANGPGSFTGLRIGASVAKALAHATGKKIVPVSTLRALAYNVLTEGKIIIPIMDAKRDQVYTSAFEYAGGELKALLPDRADDLQNVIDLASKYSKPVIFVGCGCEVYHDEISGFEIALANCNLARASSVGLAAIETIRKGKYVNYNEFGINYARKPQAERELEQKS